MTITVREPGTKAFININAYPEEYKNSPAWRIQYPGIQPILMIKQGGKWIVTDNTTINIEVAEAVVEAMKQLED
ncbi:hypothetical protein RYH73_14940 [Olivibacter sp. CPCC 100613]|uniref:hypothetical protein n=1 Tax=Olivibacter sp. CPCC 100613 TaxID=3079931 RepID=UPI002FFCB377